MKIINRYIITELIVPFFLSLLVLTFVLLLSKILNIAELLFEKNVNLATMFKIIGSITLYLTGLTLPLAFLVSMLISFGRMSSDNEIVALRTSGFSILRIAVPVLILCIVLCGISLLLHVSILPRANWNAARSIQNLAQHATSLLEEKVWMDGFGDSSVYVKNLENQNRFRHMAIHQTIPNHSLPRVIVAESGVFHFNETSREVSFTLHNGHIEEPSDSQKKNFMRIDFENYSVSLPVTKKVFTRSPKRIYHLTYTELEDQIKRTPVDRIDYRSLLHEKHSRMAMAFACLVFLLLGFPLSIHLQRAEKSTNIVIAGTLALAWYLMMMLGRGLALSGHLPVIAGTWISNLIMLSLGFVLMTRMMRR